MPELVECRNCSRQVSKEAEKCPNCREIYPSLSAVETQKHYSHCISCGERLLINDYVMEDDTPFLGRLSDYRICPKCGQPNPIQDRHVHFPPNFLATHSYLIVTMGCLSFVVLFVILIIVLFYL